MCCMCIFARFLCGCAHDVNLLDFFYLLHNQCVIRMARVFGYKKADNYAYEDGKQDTVAYELPAFLRASCVGREADTARGYQLAQASSPEAEAARHTYRAAYWSYVRFGQTTCLR